MKKLVALAIVMSSSSRVLAEDAALEKRVADLEAEVKKLKAAEPPVKTGSDAMLVLSGYVEAFYQWNFNQPSNFITNYRGFDNRHNIFTIDNIVLDALGKFDRVQAHFAVQVGNTPETYYSQEPVWRATAGAGASGPDVWKLVQQANVGYKAPIGNGLLMEAGIFVSPIGPETLPIKDNFNWSRSNLFFALPYYHTGVRATYPLTDRWSATAMLCNGWNSVVDDNIELSLSGMVTYTAADTFSATLLYFGGVERPTNAPEGRAWRNLFDAYATWSPTKRVSTIFHADAGFEPNNFGTSAWGAGAVSVRVQPLSWMYLSARADAFYENVPAGATPIFWGGSRWVTSQTATFDVRPNANMSVRLELRHDESQAPIYFAGDVGTDSGGNYITNARSQTTITAGAVAWF
ncbi:MAG TPA: outer membrane beta-barrel protein [Polyangiaceae bacterium]|nr:outer membrane beta-barrel protein [Polyangiaceae bacterium]